MVNFLLLLKPQQSVSRCDGAHQVDNKQLKLNCQILHKTKRGGRSNIYTDYHWASWGQVLKDFSLNLF